MMAMRILVHPYPVLRPSMRTTSRARVKIRFWSKSKGKTTISSFAAQLHGFLEHAARCMTDDHGVMSARRDDDGGSKRIDDVSKRNVERSSDRCSISRLVKAAA
jgi:hypothetical protein